MSTATELHPTPSTASGGSPVAPLAEVVGAGLRVPLATGGSVTYANLDYAASAPALRVVAERVEQALPFYSSVHRGAGWASQVSSRLYEGARARVARFVGARDDDVVVLVRNTTDALNLLSRAVPEGAGDVVVLEIEHHANLLPWTARAHRVVGVSSTVERTLESVEAALAEAPAALVAVTGASNVTGEELPVAELAELAHRYGARIAVDAAQLAPHRRISLAANGIDYLALSGHKIYAPFGSGALIGRRDWLDEAEPYLAGGGAVQSVDLDDVVWAPAPARHEAGTPNVLGAVALAAACDALDALPAGALEVHESALRERLIAGLKTVDGVRVHTIWADSRSTIGVVTFTVADLDAGLVAAVLSAEHGIGVRDGKFCAHPLLRRIGLEDGAVRASLGAGSSSDDVDRLVAAVRSIVDQGPALSYHRVEGRFAPVDDRRQLPAWLDLPAGRAVGSPCEER